MPKHSYLQEASALLQNWKQRVFSTTEVCIYRLQLANQVAIESDDAGFSVNNFSDLRAFDENAGWMTHDAFLAEAQDRIAKGEQIQTVVKNETLAHYGWLVAPASERYVSEVDGLIELPARSAYAYDFFTHPQFRNTGLYQQSLRHIIARLKRSGQIDDVYVGVVLQNRSSRSAIEKVGFLHFCSLLQSWRYGRVLRWSVQKNEHVGLAVECTPEDPLHPGLHFSAKACFRIVPLA